MSFGQPWWLLGSLVLLWPWLHRRRPRAAYLGPAFLMASLPRTWRDRCQPMLAALESLVVALLVVALADPRIETTLPPEAEGAEILLLIDRSSSMEGHDLDVSRSRLELAIDAATSFVKGRQDDRIGVIAFARYPDLLGPSTLDHEAVEEILAGMETVAADGAEDLTGIGTAVARAARILEPRTAASKVVILLTDGAENVATPAAPDALHPIEAAALCRTLGIRVHAIALGAEPQGMQALQDLALTTGGSAAPAAGGSALDDLFAAIDRMEKTPLGTDRRAFRSVAMECVLSALLLLVLIRWTWQQFFFVRHPWRGTVLGGMVALVALVWAPERSPRPVVKTQHQDWWIALDVSRSMYAADLAPNRLDWAKEAIRRTLMEMAGGRVGLILFAGEARVWIPLTDDRRSFIEMLHLAQPQGLRRGGSELAAALHLVSEQFPSTEGGQFLLVTDGEDLGGAGGAEAEALAQQGVRVDVLGVGTVEGARIVVPSPRGEEFLRDAEGRPVVSHLDAAGLRHIAEVTGGEFHRAGEVPAVPDEQWPRTLAGHRHDSPSPGYLGLLLLALGCWLPGLRRRVGLNS